MFIYKYKQINSAGFIFIILYLQSPDHQYPFLRPYKLMSCCKLYTFAISIFSVFFLFYLFLLVLFDSETLYIKLHNHFASAVAIFIALLIWAGVAGYLYYDIFVNIDRKQDLKRWIQERKDIHEKRQVQRRSRVSKSSSAQNLD